MLESSHSYANPSEMCGFMRTGRGLPFSDKVRPRMCTGDFEW